MVARVGETVPKVKAAAIRPSSARPQIAPRSAVIRGRTAAMMLPKPMRRTTIATAKPMASLVRSSASGRASSPSVPPYSTVTPASRSGCTAVSTPVR